jgi:hypothetical protein
VKRYEVSYAVNTVDGKTVTLSINAAGFMFTETYLIFHDDEDQTVLAVPLSREPVVMAATA